MVIVEEKNKFEKIRKKIKKIKSLWDIQLPKKYYLDEEDITLRYKLLLGGYRVADIDIKEDVIIINFRGEEEDYKRLRNCFKDSKTKFRLIVNENYY